MKTEHRLIFLAIVFGALILIVPPLLNSHHDAFVFCGVIATFLVIYYAAWCLQAIIRDEMKMLKERKQVPTNKQKEQDP